MLAQDVPFASAADPYRPEFLEPEPPLAEPPRPPLKWPKRVAYALLALLLAMFLWLAITAPLSKSLQPIAAPGITLLSAEGVPIARSGAISDQPVDVTKLPDHVWQAFLAVEDRRFYMHLGIDPWGILRAAVRNTMAGRVREGGSTITQQLAKLSFLSSDQTAARKIREAFIALWLETWLDKDEILSRYISNAYFGDNVYGLRAASRYYFSREPDDLSVEQAAMLAGVIQSPSRLAPTTNMKAARRRAAVVTAAMVDAGYLSRREAARLKPVLLRRGASKKLPTGTYFADWVLSQARAAAGAGYGEQTVKTTLDRDLQRLAIQAVGRAKLGNAQVALVAMRPDGRVVAMLGGKNYKDSSFNRATQARRQPGSTFKLFVYLAALRAGMDPDDKIEDEPLTIGDYSPRNNGGNYRGLITLREAFAVSSNVAAVRLAERVGRVQVIRAARDLGVTSRLTSDPSLALGTSGLTLLELTSAYAAVAGNRYPVKPRGLPEVEQGWFDRFWNNGKRFGGDDDEMLRDLLWAAANKGTGRAAALRVDTFGKTGTTQDNRDAIFVGFAGDLVTAVWVGNDDNTPLKGIQGGGLPARIWKDFMSRAVRGAAAPQRAPRPRAASAKADTPRLSVPIEGTGYDVGVEFGDDAVTFSAQPLPGGDERREPIEVPIIVPPPPAPEEERLEGE